MIGGRGAARGRTLFLVGGNRSRKLVPVQGERSWWWYCSDCRLRRAQEGLSLRPDRYGGSRPFRVFLLKLSALTLAGEPRAGGTQNFTVTQSSYRPANDLWKELKSTKVISNRVSMTSQQAVCRPYCLVVVWSASTEYSVTYVEKCWEIPKKPRQGGSQLRSWSCLLRTPQGSLLPQNPLYEFLRKGSKEFYSNWAQNSWWLRSPRQAA